MLRKWLTEKAISRETTGARMELQASCWLAQQGLKYIESNYRCKLGEIDIIMLDGQQLVFVEVRYRRQTAFGGAAASVDRRKQKKLLKAAAHYLLQHPIYRSHSCRFDVMAVEPAKDKAELVWYWIQNAFSE
jgi:putative endonuclease